MKGQAAFEFLGIVIVATLLFTIFGLFITSQFSSVIPWTTQNPQAGFFADRIAKAIDSSYLGGSGYHTTFELPEAIGGRDYHVNYSTANKAVEVNIIDKGHIDSYEIAYFLAPNLIMYGVGNGTNHVININGTVILYADSVKDVIFDTTPPSLTISSPTNIDYYQDTVWVNVTTNESVVWCGYELDSAANQTMNGNETQWYYNSTGLSNGSHNVVVYCNDSSGNIGVSTPQYFTIILPPEKDFKIQRGYTIMNAASATATITAGVDYTAPTGPAFIRLTNTRLSGMGRTSGGTQNADDFTTYISNPENLGTSITFERHGTANNNRLAWEIIEYIGLDGYENEMKVRSVGTAMFGTADLTVNSSTINGIVNDNNVVVFITGQANPDTGTTDVNTGMCTSEWISGATDVASFTRGEAGSDATDVSYAVIEFTGTNWKVQRTEHQYTAAGAWETESITPTNNVNKVFLHTQHRAGTNLQGLDEQGNEAYLSNTSTIQFQIQSSATTPSSHYTVAWVVEYNGITGTQMNVQHITGTRDAGGSEEDTWTNTITPVQTNATSIMGENCRSAGSGTAFPRGFNTITLLNSTTVEHKRSDTGQPQSYRYSVVKWPSSVDDITAPIILIDSPANTTIDPIKVWFNISLDEPGDWAGYSLNGTANQTMSGSGNQWYYQDTGLNENSYNITFFANDTLGNMGVSSTRWFTVDDSTPPQITIDYPVNITYGTSWTWVNITTNESADWCGYSINGTANQTMNGNETQWYYNASGLNDGSNNVVVYCNDSYSNIGVSAERYFSIDSSLTEQYKVQRGYTLINAASATATITAGVDYTAPTGPAFIRLTNTRLSGMGRTASGGNQNVDDFTTYISNPENLGTSITFERHGTANDNRLAWEIIEYIGSGGGNNEFVVRGVGTATFGTTGLNVNSTTVSGVNDDNDVVVFITGQANPDTGRSDANTGMCTSEWVSGTNITQFTRGEAGSDATDVSYAVIEFTGTNWKVQRTEHQYTAAGAWETESITTVNSLAKTFLHTQHRAGTGQQGLDEQGNEAYLSDTSTIQFQIQSSATTPSSHYTVAWVVENTGSDARELNVQHMAGTRATGGSEEDTWTDTITSVAPETTSIMGENGRSAGSGTAFPRGFNTITLLNSTTVEHKQSDTGQQQVYHYSVVGWPAE